MNKIHPIKGTPTIEGTEARIEDGWRIETPIEKKDQDITGDLNADGVVAGTKIAVSRSSKDLKKDLNNLRGKYIKQLLSKLEELDVLDIVVRKVVLDALNDYSRDVLKELGYETE